MASDKQTIKYIKDADGNLLKIDYEAIANPPIIEQAEFVIGDDGTEDEGILSIEGVQGGNFTDPDGELVDLSEYSTTAQMTVAINTSKSEAIDESKSYTDQAIENIDNSDIINMIEKLHYYCNKNIIPTEDAITIELSDEATPLVTIDCSKCINGELILPVRKEMTGSSIGYPTYTILNSELVKKIVIPRDTFFDFYYDLGAESFLNGPEWRTWSDETFLEYFPNLEVLVRVHEDGAVSSYNLKTETLN